MVLPRKSTNARHARVLWNRIQTATDGCCGSTTPTSSSRTKVQMRTLRILVFMLLLLAWFVFKTVLIMMTTSATTIPLRAEQAIETITATTQSTIQSSSTTIVGLRLAPQLTIVSEQSKAEEQTKHDTMSSVPEQDTTNATTTATSSTIAYAISLVKCGDHQTNAAGLTDAALILRHSIHVISCRNPESNSKYDYVMVAIVHRQAVPCSHILRKVGFQIMIVDSPVQRQDIQGDYLKKHIQKEWCCGHGECVVIAWHFVHPSFTLRTRHPSLVQTPIACSVHSLSISLLRAIKTDEFIKWFPYTMTDYPAVVHVDIDFAFFRPMDELFDAMMYPADSELGRAARAKIATERPSEALPDRIDAFFTRDWPQVMPGRLPGYQAGFVVVRPDPTVFEELAAIVKKGDYVSGYSRANGWGGLGYGGFVGAMAMQGLMAYYYDHVRPNTSVELNQCRYNWMGMDVRYRAQPNFNSRSAKVGRCRNDKDTCEDCTITPLDQIQSAHYTQCRKPWNCIGIGVQGGARGSAIDTSAGSYEKCMEVVTKWHSLRTDFEAKLFRLTSDQRLLKAASHTYMVEVFQGHCAGEGGKNYTPIDATDDTFAMVPKLYE